MPRGLNGCGCGCRGVGDGVISDSAHGILLQGGWRRLDAWEYSYAARNGNFATIMCMIEIAARACLDYRQYISAESHLFHVDTDLSLIPRTHDAAHCSPRTR